MCDETGYLRRLAYTCIFSSSPSDASENMYRHISKKQCGFDEGSDKWITIIENVLSKTLNLKELNFHITDRHESWWNDSLSGLLDKLRDKKLLASG